MSKPWRAGSRSSSPGYSGLLLGELLACAWSNPFPRMVQERMTCERGIKKGERTTRYGGWRPATAKCRAGSSSCWSSYNNVLICILGMQMVLQQLLETV
jgi:hypothetical protein